MFATLITTRRVSEGPLADVAVATHVTPSLTHFEVTRLVRILTRRVSEGTTYVALATRVNSPSLTRRVVKNTANHVDTSFKTMKSATSKLTHRVEKNTVSFDR